MSDVENAYKQIASFLNNETEKTLLICGIADEEKHRTLLKALNARGRSKGLIFLIHTTKDGMENFFRWAGLYKVKVPKKYAKYYSEVAQGYLISIRHKDARLTIRDSVGGGALIGEFNQEFYFQFIDVYGGTLVMESGTVKMLCPSKDNQYTKCAISVSGTAVFNGGEVLTQVTSPQGEREERYLSRRLQAIRGEKGGSVTINGGTFDRVVLHSAPTPENRGKYELVVNGGFFRQSIALILTGDVYISTCGYGITVFTDAGIEYIGKQIKGDLSDSNFAGAFDKFADLCDDFITQARTGEPYDVRNLPKEPLSLIWIPIAIVVGFVLSLIIVGRMKAKLKTVRFQAAANSYIKDGSLNITESREMFLYNTVTRTAKPKDSDSGGGSSTHTSSSGSSHGGGGGKFWYQLRPQEKAAIKNYIKGR